MKAEDFKLGTAFRLCRIGSATTHSVAHVFSPRALVLESSNGYRRNAKITDDGLVVFDIHEDFPVLYSEAVPLNQIVELLTEPVPQ